MFAKLVLAALSLVAAASAVTVDPAKVRSSLSRSLLVVIVHALTVQACYLVVYTLHGRIDLSRFYGERSDASVAH